MKIEHALIRTHTGAVSSCENKAADVRGQVHCSGLLGPEELVDGNGEIPVLVTRTAEFDQRISLKRGKVSPLGECH